MSQLKSNGGGTFKPGGFAHGVISVQYLPVAMVVAMMVAMAISGASLYRGAILSLQLHRKGRGENTEHW